ncbi:hypothetical protein EC988_000342 [Linderina pennispora]|nr:hypothetical protein EC988_000342 [Linderina pennispora]
MEFVQEHLTAIIKGIRRNAEDHQSGTPDTPGSANRKQAEISTADVSELYMLLGRDRTRMALELVDRGVVCMHNGGRNVFRVRRHADELDLDSCYCLLPGWFCNACAADSSAGAALPCIHVVAVLLAVLQGKCTAEQVPADDLAVVIFSHM